MPEVRVLSPTGMLGSGFFSDSLERGMEKKPHFIACDSGSTDPGPHPLGEGVSIFSKHAIKRDLSLMLKAAVVGKIPLIIGSCGIAGADPQVEWTYDIVKEIAREEGFQLEVALIHAEQDKSYLLSKLEQGKISELWPAPKIDSDVINRAVRIVGMMGIEPINRALEKGAQVVLCGRSSDTSIFAAIPVSKGIDPGLAWHAAKILECGAAAVVNRISPDSMMGYLRDDHFIIEPMHPEMRCTPQSVAAHSLYETSDPFRIQEPSGALDTSQAQYSAHSDSSVKVKGSKFIPSPVYTVKLEAAELVGYQSIIIGGIRDPYVVRQFNRWLESVMERLSIRLKDVFGDEWYDLYPRAYGRNGVMAGLEPVKEIASHEIGLVFEVTAKTQQLASSMASVVRHIVLHHPIPEWSGSVSTVAFPYSPPLIDRGPVYRFSLNHVVEPDDPYEMFPIEMRTI